MAPDIPNRPTVLECAAHVISLLNMLVTESAIFCQWFWSKRKIRTTTLEEHRVAPLAQSLSLQFGVPFPLVILVSMLRSNLPVKNCCACKEGLQNNAFNQESRVARKGRGRRQK